MNTSLPSNESKLLKYLNCLEKSDNYIIVSYEEVKQIIEAVKDFSLEEINGLFINLEKFDYIKIKYKNNENFLIILTEKGKKFSESSKLKNSHILRKNATFYTFLLTFFGSFFSSLLVLVIYLFLYNYVK